MYRVGIGKVGLGKKDDSKTHRLPKLPCPGSNEMSTPLTVADSLASTSCGTAGGVETVEGARDGETAGARVGATVVGAEYGESVGA